MIFSQFISISLPLPLPSTLSSPTRFTCHWLPPVRKRHIDERSVFGQLLNGAFHQRVIFIVRDPKHHEHLWPERREDGHHVLARDARQISRAPSNRCGEVVLSRILQPECAKGISNVEGEVEVNVAQLEDNLDFGRRDRV